MKSKALYIFRIFCSVLLVATCASCEKYLDVEPKGVVVPSKITDYDLLLNQNESRKNPGFVKSYSMDLPLSDDMTIEEFTLNFYSQQELNAYAFKEHFYLEDETDTDWQSLYGQIYVSNVIIQEVLEAEGGTISEKMSLQNEARVHRAFAYLTLVNLYAKHYNPSTASTDLGVPIRTDIDFEEDLTRATVQEVYEFILNDLSLALQELPSSPKIGSTHRPNLAAAYALLARTYLFMNNIEEALSAATSSLEIYDTLLDFNTLGVLFPAPAPPFNDLVRGYENPEVLLYKEPSLPSSLFYWDRGLQNLYASFTRETDLRLITKGLPDFILPAPIGGHLSSEWFNGRAPNKGLSTAEVYLIKAECHARLGDVQPAIETLNTLRKYRFLTGAPYSLEANSAAEALVLVKEERRKELAFQGVRLFDIKRYNTYDDANISITHTLPDGQTFALSADSPRFVVPIARKYIILNPEIEQNPR